MHTWTSGAVRLLILVLLLACAPAAQEKREPAAEAGVLAYRYAGTLPCAGCDGIRTMLELFEKTPDGPPSTYRIQEVHLTREGDLAFSSTGSWLLLRGAPEDPDAIVFQLDPDRADRTRNFLKRGEHELVPLDRDRKAIESSLPHSLTRVEVEAVDPIVVTDADAARVIALAPGQSLIVRLASNQRAGFRWTLTYPLSRVFSIVAEPVYVASAPVAGADDSGGFELWHVTFPVSGKHSLQIEYRSRWERDGAPEKTVSFAVNVSR